MKKEYKPIQFEKIIIGTILFLILITELFL